MDLFSITDHFTCCLGRVDLFIVFLNIPGESDRFDCQPAACFLLLRNEMPRLFAASFVRRRCHVLTNLRSAQTDLNKAVRLFLKPVLDRRHESV